MGARSAGIERECTMPLAGTGWRIIQAQRGYRHSVESLLLAHAADPQPGEQVLDLGAGNGTVTFLLATKAPACRIVGLEIQKAMAERARRAVRLNGCEGRVAIVAGDLRRPADHLAAGEFDLVVSAPPYWAAGVGPVSPVPEVAAARHEILCSLAEVVAAAVYALAPAGRFWMIHRAARLPDLVATLEAHGLCGIWVRPVRSRAADRATFILVRAVRRERSSLAWLPPLTLYRGPGRSFSPALRAVHAAFGRPIGEETA